MLTSGGPGGAAGRAASAAAGAERPSAAGLGREDAAAPPPPPPAPPLPARRGEDDDDDYDGGGAAAASRALDHRAAICPRCFRHGAPPPPGPGRRPIRPRLTQPARRACATPRDGARPGPPTRMPAPRAARNCRRRPVAVLTQLLGKAELAGFPPLSPAAVPTLGFTVRGGWSDWWNSGFLFLFFFWKQVLASGSSPSPPASRISSWCPIPAIITKPSPLSGVFQPLKKVYQDGVHNC